MRGTTPRVTGATEKDRGRSDAGEFPARLRRTMGGFGALLITLSGLSPSIGVFVVGSDVIHQAGVGAFVCFAAAAVLGLAIANVYAELAAAFPETGGEYTIVGRTLGPPWGFAMLGLNLLTFSIAPAMTALGVVSYLKVVAPALPEAPTAALIVLVVTAIAVLNIRLNALVTGLFLAAELACLGVIAWLGFSHPHRGLGAVALHPVMLGPHGLASVSLAKLGIGAAAAIYAFDGYGSVVYLGEELHDAPRRIASVVFWALGLGVIWQLAPMLALLTGAPDLQRLISASSPVAGFISAVGGAGLARLMSLGVALALLNAMIASALMGGRQLYSSGRDGAWGHRLSAAFAQIHPRFNSPWIATLALGATSTLWCLVKLPLLVILIGDGTAAIYLYMCLAALWGRRRGITSHAPFRMPLFPAFPLLAIVALLGVGVADLLDEDGRKGLFVSAAVIVLSATYYALALRPSGEWRDRGPARE